MQLSLQHLGAHLQKGLAPLYTLHGDEPLLVQEAGDAIRQAARAQGFTERSLFVVQGAHFDWSAVQAAAGALSLFADRQIVEIRIPSGKPGKDGAVALQALAENARDNTDTLLLVTLPRLDKAARSSTWMAALEQGVSLSIETVERAALPRWIAQRLQQRGFQVASGVDGERMLQFFADRVEGNLLAAHQEVEKLALLCPPGPLGFEQVEAAVLHVARYDVYKLSEAVLSGQLGRVQRMLDGLQAEGDSPVLVHWALAEDIRTVQRLDLAVRAGRPLPMALREHRVWGAREKLFERLMERGLKNAPPEEVANWVWAAHQVDGIVKGLRHADWPTDPWQALSRLAALVCQRAAPQPNSRPSSPRPAAQPTRPAPART